MQYKPLMAELGRQWWWFSEFKASLVYRTSFWTARTTKRNPVSKKPINKQTKVQMLHFIHP